MKYYVSGKDFGTYLTKKEVICALGLSNVIRCINKAIELGKLEITIIDDARDEITYHFCPR